MSNYRYEKLLITSISGGGYATLTNGTTDTRFYVNQIDVHENDGSASPGTILLMTYSTDGFVADFQYIRREAVNLLADATHTMFKQAGGGLVLNPGDAVRVNDTSATAFITVVMSGAKETV
jgi:hypothetical protein